MIGCNDPRVGLLSRFKRLPPHALMPKTGHTFLLSGVTFYQAELSRSGPGRHAVRLFAQHDNPHDPLAVAALINGRIVGHISRGMAPRYREAIERLEATGRQVWVSATVRRDPGLYVEIDCPFPEQFD
jgi:hypothetical protein